MQTKKINLAESDLHQYQQIESSIEHWSIEHTKSALQTKRLLGAVESMYEGRMQHMNSIIKANGINPAHVHNVHVNIDDGSVEISYDETVPNPAADPSESSDVSPTANPS